MIGPRAPTRIVTLEDCPAARTHTWTPLVDKPNTVRDSPGTSNYPVLEGPCLRNCQSIHDLRKGLLPPVGEALLSCVAHGDASGSPRAGAGRKRTSDFLFGAFSLQSGPLELALTRPSRENRFDLFPARRPRNHHPQQVQGVLARTQPGPQIHQQHRDQSYVELHQNARTRFAPHTAEPRATLQPAEEQLYLPAIAVNQPDDVRWDVQQAGQQANLSAGFVGRFDDHLAVPPRGGRAVRRAHAIAHPGPDHPAFATLVAERALLVSLEAWGAWPGFAESVHEIGLAGVRGDQVEAEDAAVVDVDRTRDDRLLGMLSLALAVGDRDDFGQPCGDVDMDVQPDGASGRFLGRPALPTTFLEGPRDVRGD